MGSRVSQLPAEVVRDAGGLQAARISQLPVEVVRNATAQEQEVRVTQVAVEVAALLDLATVAARVSQMAVEVAVDDTIPQPLPGDLTSSGALESILMQAPQGGGGGEGKSFAFPAFAKWWIS